VSVTTVKRLLFCGFRRTRTSVSMLVENMSRNKFFFQVLISYVLRYISIYVLFNYSPRINKGLRNIVAVCG
jgi:hypothetical protein